MTSALAGRRDPVEHGLLARPRPARQERDQAALALEGDLPVDTDRELAALALGDDGGDAEALRDGGDKTCRQTLCAASDGAVSDLDLHGGGS
ncbi:MAG: hypothetical protein AAFP86_08990 [Planctomycetota bacterium]